MMLANVHLAPSDDEDLYSGFGNEEVAPALQTEDIEYDEGFQVKTKGILFIILDASPTFLPFVKNVIKVAL